MSAGRPDTRLVWAAVSPESRACARFSVYCSAPYSAPSRLGRCQLVLGVSGGEVAVRVYDRFLVWCRVQDCWCLYIQLGQLRLNPPGLGSKCGKWVERLSDF